MSSVSVSTITLSKNRGTKKAHRFAVHGSCGCDEYSIPNTLAIKANTPGTHSIEMNDCLNVNAISFTEYHILCFRCNVYR